MRSKLITDFMINRYSNQNSDIFVDVHSKDGDICPFDQQSAHDIFYVDDDTGHRSDILSKALVEKVQSASAAMLQHPILSKLPDTPAVPEEVQSEVGVKSRYISSLAEQSRYNQMLADNLQTDANTVPEPPASVSSTASEPSAPESPASSDTTK